MHSGAGHRSGPKPAINAYGESPTSNQSPDARIRWWQAPRRWATIVTCWPPSI